MGDVRSVGSVLIVDDDDVVRGGFQRAFTAKGKRVFAATDASSARRLAKQERPDLALVDLRLGGDWGLDLITDLKTDVPDIEIALVSGFVGTDAAVAALRAGARHVFTKPVTCATILRQVEDGVIAVEPNRDLPSIAYVQWEHLMRALAEAKGNVSAAARRLRISRQSLQQRLKKPAPPD